VPRVTFDLVTEDPVHGEAVVYLVEEGPWPRDEAGWDARLRGIQDRLYDAVDAVVDGRLAARFPDLHGKPVRIQIDSPSGCPTRLQVFVRRFGEALAGPGEYREAIARSAFVNGLRVVTGHEMGRFQPKC
jgi:hypothetical protein